MPDIYWLIAAQRRFLEAMDSGRPPCEIRQRYQGVCRKLAATFSNAASVIVRQRLSGYSVRADLHILLVEVVWRCDALHAPPDGAIDEGQSPASGGDTICIGLPDFCLGELGVTTQTTAHVVKLADDLQLLARELEAWESCRPVGMTHDSVLMRLRSGVERFNQATGPVSIVYEDANHVIGTGLVMPLEEVILDACVWGTPTVESIEILLKCLFERLGGDLYSRSRIKPRAQDNLTALCEWKHLRTWLDDWKDTIWLGPEPQLDRHRIRREVFGFLTPEPQSFLDPVDYLRSVVACPEYCPVLLWGCSDGDLHGRNVLVSVLDDDVSLPAVYDFADMGLDNLVGWDFVKLETELKVRALPMIFSGPEPEYIHQVGRFECYLAQRTQAMHDQRGETEEQTQAKDFAGPERAQRLARILLTIRSEARRHLGVLRHRDRQWLEEYYFLLACYGTCAGRFPSYQGLRRQIAAAYISAAAAARLLSRPWNQLEARIREAAAEAERILRAAESDPDPDPELDPDLGPDRDPGVCKPVPPLPTFDRTTRRLTGAPCEMSHHGRLAFARVWARSCNASFIKDAVSILKQLRVEFPHVLEIEEELALAYLELDRSKDAELLLYEVALRYGQLSEEMLCRFGRVWKDKGNKVRVEDRAGAGRLFELGLEWYRQAYARRKDYYPGINLATLHFVLGQKEQARKTTEAVLSKLEAEHHRDELVWVWATQAEAQLLLASYPPGSKTLELCREAENLYRQAVDDCPEHAVQTMRRQAELIAAYAIPEIQQYWTKARLEDVFKPPALRNQPAKNPERQPPHTSSAKPPGDPPEA